MSTMEEQDIVEDTPKTIDDHKTIAKKQRPSTTALQTHMENNELDRLDCGGGWFMTSSKEWVRIPIVYSK